MIGPQGSGKGTQAEKLAERLGIPAISMGRLLRQIAEKDTSLGKQVDQTINAGKMLPDDLTDQVVRERLNRDDVQGGYILDGFPRRLNQLDLLLKIDQPTHAVLINLDDDTAVERISGRRTCFACGKIYHIEFNPSLEGKCVCGGNPEQREDDTPEAIRKRLKIYHEQTEPMVDRYREMGILVEINGSGSIKEVEKEIVNKLEL
jgi:adenylate kinase